MPAKMVMRYEFESKPFHTPVVERELFLAPYSSDIHKFTLIPLSFVKLVIVICSLTHFPWTKVVVWFQYRWGKSIGEYFAFDKVSWGLMLWDVQRLIHIEWFLPMVFIWQGRRKVQVALGANRWKMKRFR